MNATETDGSDVDAEATHFKRILNAFRYYKFHSLKSLQQRKQYFETLSDDHKRLLPSFLEHLNQLQVCVEHNAEIIKLMLSETRSMFENVLIPDAVNSGLFKDKAVVPKAMDMDKVRTTLKQIWRDWSLPGKIERDQCYSIILDEIKNRLNPKSENESSKCHMHVLVPGAGCGRLVWEIAKLGYSCQGNEWSLFMLIASHFVLNKCTEPNTFTLYPWCQNFCNNLSSAHQLEGVSFPDVNPSDIPSGVQFSMAAGDFLEVYTQSGYFDCVATAFFIDTAHNIIDYIERIFDILKPGGYWINIGPLLYHYADMPGELSIEISWEELLNVILQCGFSLLVCTGSV